MRRRLRTIISLDDEVHRRAKSYAAEHGTTLRALVEEALRARLAERRSKRRPPVRLPTFRGEGLQDGLSLDAMGTIYDRLDGLR
jgi:plasmid stability protein